MFTLMCFNAHVIFINVGVHSSEIGSSHLFLPKCLRNRLDVPGCAPLDHGRSLSGARGAKPLMDYRQWKNILISTCIYIISKRLLWLNQTTQSLPIALIIADVGAIPTYFRPIIYQPICFF